MTVDPWWIVIALCVYVGLSWWMRGRERIAYLDAMVRLNREETKRIRLVAKLPPEPDHEPEA